MPRVFRPPRPPAAVKAFGVLYFSSIVIIVIQQCLWMGLLGHITAGLGIEFTCLLLLAYSCWMLLQGMRSVQLGLELGWIVQVVYFGFNFRRPGQDSQAALRSALGFTSLLLQLLSLLALRTKAARIWLSETWVLLKAWVNAKKPA